MHLVSERAPFYVGLRGRQSLWCVKGGWKKGRYPSQNGGFIPAAVYTQCLRMEVRLMLISAVAADIKNNRLFLHLSQKGPQTCPQGCRKLSGIRAMEVNQQQDIGMMARNNIEVYQDGKR